MKDTNTTVTVPGESSAIVDNSHHPFGPSKWPAVLDCPCFESDGGGAESDVGTRCHEIFASIVAAFCNSHDDYLRICDEIGDAPSADVAAKFALRAWSEVLNRFVNGHSDEFIKTAKAETRIECKAYFGTCDLTWRSGGYLHVYDLKSFHNPGRDYTAQLAGYAICLMDDTDTIVHLHVGYGEDGMIDDKAISRTECEVWRANALSILRNRGKFTGDYARQCEWCAHCAHKGVCPAHMAVAKIAEKDAISSSPSIARWLDLSSDKKAKLMLLAETVMKWAEAIREAAKQDLMTGTPIMSAEDNAAWTLRTARGRATPRIRDFWALAKANGVSADAVMDAVKISTSDATSLLVKCTGMKRKEAASLVDTVSDRGADTVTMVRTTVEG